MPARKFAPKEKLLILDEVFKNGQKVTSVCRKWQISRFTFYNWAKNWRPQNNLRRESLLRDRRLNGKFHPKAIKGKREKLILECVLRNPVWSSHRIEQFLAEYLNGTFKVSNHGIANVLNRYGLNTEEERFEYSRVHLTRSIFPNKFTDFEKYKIIEEYLIKGRKIAQISRQFHISRFTFYAWLKKYEQERTVSSLADSRPRAESHWKYIGDAIKQKVLDVVAASPAYSVHKIHAHLAGEVGHHAIQNILAREDLNTFYKRQIFAQGYAQEPQVQVAPLYEAPVMRLSLWRLLFAPFRTVPKWVIKHPASWPIAFPALAFLAYIFEADKLARPAMFFPIVALTFGFVFFLYSVKYYISLIIVMRLAQSGGGGAIDKEQLTIDKKSIISRLRRLVGIEEKERIARINPLLMNLDRVKLDSAQQPFVSVHVAVYNEKKVIERLIEACKNQKWTNYEVILADDSTDETTEIIKNALSGGGRRLENTFGDEVMEIFVSKPAKSGEGPIFKIVHRFNRDGFKGAALQKALENTNPYADFIVVFDADFVPYADTIEQFVKAFQVLGGNQGQSREIKDDQGLENPNKPSSTLINPDNPGSRIAAVQGYQWHVLNKSENWVTRGVRSEYAGSYVIERAGIGIYGGLNMIAGSVFCLRADILRKFGWGKSITEDLELTLRLYEAGYKVVFTPHIQAPAEAVSTVKRLIRQRMRWAEGHTFNIRKMWSRILGSPKLNRREKFEFLYLSPYYLQAAFFIIGSLAWFIAEVVLHVNLPFWTAAWGWSLVFVNFLSLPLMNLIGLFLEESDERDYLGIASFIVLSYILVPFQAYAAVKALFEDKEGPWFRTPKTGNITDIFDRVRFYAWIEKVKIWGGKKAQEVATATCDFPQVVGGKTNLANLSVSSASYSSFNPLSGYKIRPRRIPLLARGTLAILLIVVMSLNYLAFFAPPTEARHSTPHLEQQHNILDRNVLEGSTTSYAPTDDSAGLVQYNDSNLSHETAYFEAVLKVQGVDVGQYTSIYCVTATDCKIAYYDVSNGDLKVIDCDNATCTSGAITTVDSTNNVGKYASIYCISTSECKIAYQDVTNLDLKFMSCVDGVGDGDTYPCNTASERTTNLLDGNTGCKLTLGNGCATSGSYGSYISLYCPSATNCKITYGDSNSSDLNFGDCDDTNCGSGSKTIADTETTSNTFTSLDCSQGSTDCKIAYAVQPPQGLSFIDCGDETCTTTNHTKTTIISENVGVLNIDCTTGATDCKIAYMLNSTADLKFVDCGQLDCGTTNRTISVLDGNSSCTLTNCSTSNSVGFWPSLYCVSSTDCKISYYDNTNATLKFADCNTATCAGAGPGETNTVGSTTGVGQYTSLYCIESSGGAGDASSNCKISYYDSFNGDLDLRDCDSSNCTTGSSSIADSGITSGITAYAALFPAGGGSTAVTCGAGSAEVSTTNEYYTRVRTSCSLTLSNNTNYTVRTKTSNTSNKSKLSAARIIYIQNPGTNHVTATQTSVEIGNYQASFANTSASDLTYKKLYCYDSNSNNGSDCAAASSSKFNPSPSFRFEATLQITSSTDTVYAQLVDNSSNQHALASRTGATTWGLAQDVSPTALQAGEVYNVRVYCADGPDGDSVCSGSIANAKIIINQSTDSSGVTAVETVQMYNNTFYSSSAQETQIIVKEVRNRFERNNLEQNGQTVVYYFEADFNIGSCIKTCPTISTILYSLDDLSDITNGTLATNSIPLVRLRTVDLKSNLPAGGTAKDLGIRLIAPYSPQTHDTNKSWLIIQINNLQVPEPLLFALPAALFLPKAVKKLREMLNRRKKTAEIGARA